jgi:lipopolysaccharide export system ATP-binding protein
MTSLQAEDISKSYNGRRVVKGLHLNVDGGEVVGLLGPNGAGKTTTFHLMVGLLRPDEGRVFLNGENLTSAPIHVRARAGIGYLPQEPSVFRYLTVQDNLLAILETLPLTDPERKRRISDLLAEFGIAHLARHRADTLSGGERRRVEIARALVLSPYFLLLDEPFTGIDPIAVADIQQTIRHLTEREIGVLITDHNVRETLHICDRAYILSDGTVLEEGCPEKIAASERARRIYLGDGFRL